MAGDPLERMNYPRWTVGRSGHNEREKALKLPDFRAFRFMVPARRRPNRSRAEGRDHRVKNGCFTCLSGKGLETVNAHADTVRKRRCSARSVKILFRLSVYLATVMPITPATTSGQVVSSVTDSRTAPSLSGQRRTSARRFSPSGRISGVKSPSSSSS